MAGVGEGHVAHAQRVVEAQDAGRVGDLVEAFGAEEGGDYGRIVAVLGGVELTPHVRGGGGGNEVGGEFGVEPVHEVDLLEGLAHGGEVGCVGVVAAGRRGDVLRTG